MPIYCYETLSAPCDVCGGSFEINRPLSRPPLTHCPLCKKEVRKVFSHFSSPTKTRPPTLSEVKGAGFQVFKKVDSGVYEKQ